MPRQIRRASLAKRRSRENISLMLNRENETKFSSSNSYPSKPFLRLAGFDFHPRVEFTVLFTNERERRRGSEVSIAHISCIKSDVKFSGKRTNLNEFETRARKVVPKRVSCRFCSEASQKSAFEENVLLHTAFSLSRCNRVLWVLRNRSIDRRFCMRV